MSSNPEYAKKLAEAKSYITTKSKEIEAKSNASVFNWLLGTSVTQQTNSDNLECVCGADLSSRLEGRAKQIKWMWVILAVLVLLIVILSYVINQKNKEGLYDSGIGQRRQIQLDGLGTGPTFNERMNFTQEIQPEYSE
jgi:hypothetical protein